MPTYDYQCTKCSNKFEVFQSMKDKPDSKCPKCGAKAQRLIGGGSGIIFKGSGFYQTDYKNKKKSDKPGSCPKSGSSDSCKGCPSSDK